MEILRYLVTIIYIIPSGLILAAVIILINRTQSTPAYILLVTSILSVVLQVVQGALPIIFHQLGHSITDLSNYLVITKIVSFLNSTVFGIGLILLIKHHVKSKKDNFR
jgi:hypothetical protein